MTKTCHCDNMSQSTLLIIMRYDLDQKMLQIKLDEEQWDNTLVVCGQIT